MQQASPNATASASAPPAARRSLFHAEFIPFAATSSGPERAMLQACGHYAISDRAIFVAAYRELCRLDLSGKCALEICCGGGQLALQLGQVFPQAEVIAVDRYPEAAGAVTQARATGAAPNVRYECADALHLTSHATASLDLIIGQAALHHLAHEPAQVAAEFSRVLKPGGRLIFIYEPLGHSPLVAAVRAINVARHAMVDESNLFFSTIEAIGTQFANCQVQVFNLCGYPLKSLHSDAAVPLARAANALDRFLARRWPNAVRYAANCNIIYTR